MQRYELRLYTNYNQFFIMDAADENDAMSDLPILNDADLRNRMQAADNIVAIFTERQGKTQIAFECYDVEPITELDKWDHVVEGSFQAPSGAAHVITINFTVAHAQITLGTCDYRVRVHQGGLTTVADPNTPDGDDYYLVTLWPAPAADLIVLKQYESPF